VVSDTVTPVTEPSAQLARGTAGAFSIQHGGLLAAGKNLRCQNYAPNQASPAHMAMRDIASVTN